MHLLFCYKIAEATKVSLVIVNSGTTPLSLDVSNV